MLSAKLLAFVKRSRALNSLLAQIPKMRQDVNVVAHRPGCQRRINLFVKNAQRKIK
jgi:hypothetical protein